jgi:hypothetical protein
MSAKAKSRPTRKKKFPHSIVWFEIPADNPERRQRIRRLGNGS